MENMTNLTHCNQITTDLYKETRCNGRLTVENQGTPDEVRTCPICGAKWSMDSKETD